MTHTTPTYNGQVKWKVARSTDTPTYFEVDTFARSEGLSPEGAEQWAGGAGRAWIGGSLYMSYMNADEFRWTLKLRAVNADQDWNVSRAPYHSLPNLRIDEAKEWAVRQIEAARMYHVRHYTR